jgi:hypothetical protein
MEYLEEWAPSEWKSILNVQHLAHHLRWRLLGSVSHGGHVLLFDYTDRDAISEVVYTVLALSPTAPTTDVEGFPLLNYTNLLLEYHLPVRRLLALLRALVKYFGSSESDARLSGFNSDSTVRLRALVHERHGGIDSELRTPAPSHYHLLWINPSLTSSSSSLTPTTVVHIENNILFQVTLIDPFIH